MNINQQSHHTALESFDRKSVNSTKESQNGFYDLGIAPSLLKAINRLKFEEPTPIQKESIPVGIQGDDIIALAQTGSGKTLAFGIPLLQRLSKNKRGTGLILVPTRELAIQVEESILSISRSQNVRTAVLIGGASMVMQRNILKKNPRVIIATPGRLMDHIERRTIDLSNVAVFILDEADRMLDMGFVPDIKKIMKSIPDNRQTMLFSATMPKPIESIARQLMEDPVRIETDRSGQTPSEVSQEIFLLKNQDKGRLLAFHAKECTGPVLVFTRTKRMATKLADKVNKMGFSSAEIHSDRSQGQRRNALEGFKRGRYQILIATDIAARGIDVSGIELVVNYDMPANPEDYVHRIGRTGRAGKKGHAISFATSAQKGDIRHLERFMKTKLKISSLPTLPSEKVLFKEGEQFYSEKESSRTERPPKRKSSNDRYSKRPDFKKSEPQNFRMKRSKSKPTDSQTESTGDKRPSKRNFSDDRPFKKNEYKKSASDRFKPKRFGAKTEFSNNDNSSKRKYSDERSPKRNFSEDRPSKRREFKKFDSKDSSQKRFGAKQFSSNNEFSTDDRPSKRKFSKDSPSKRRDFRNSDSTKFHSKNDQSKPGNFRRKDSDQPESKSRFTKKVFSNSPDSKQNESSNESPFWANFKKNRPSKKKKSDQGSKRKKRTKQK